MPGSVGVLVFIVVFIGAAVFITVAVGRDQKRWHARPSILRALAGRRGWRAVDNPGAPSALVLIRPLEKGANVKQLELPLAVAGHTVDGELTLFDVYTNVKTGSGNNASWVDTYQTFLVIRTTGWSWPHFEFSVISHSTPESFSGSLLAMTATLAEAKLRDRGLSHVPIADQPGYQLFVGDPDDAETLRGALTDLFRERVGWWIGALDGALTVQKSVSRSATHARLIPAVTLDAFIDESVEIERSLRNAIAMRSGRG